MSITTVQIICDVGRPNNTEFIASRLDFGLSGPDYDAASNDAIPEETVSLELDEDGTGTASLWPVDRGIRNTHYTVTLIASRTVEGRAQLKSYYLGNICPPSSGVALNLADLLAQSTGTIMAGSIIYATLADAVAAAVEAKEVFQGVVDGTVTDLTDPVNAAIAAAEAATDAANEAAAEAALLAPTYVTLEQFGGVGDGVTSDQSAWFQAKADGRPIFLNAGKRYLVTDPRNRDGRVIYGPGRIISAVDGGFTQKNSYVPPLPVRNRQHLWRVKNRITAGEHLKVAICGDSTATNGYGLDIGGAVQAEMQNIGLNVGSVVNSAVAGTGWTNGTSVVAGILDGYAEQKHLLIIKYGINEAAIDGDGNPDTTAMRNAMNSQLENIRASTYGGLDDLSILLIMPNALGNATGNSLPRSKSWVEAIIGVYQDAADAYQCALYNPYIEAQTAEGGGNRWMDAILVHPQANHNLDIWCRAIREMLMPFASVRRNRVRNIAGSLEIAPSSTSALSAYSWGLSHLRCFLADGWPDSGTVETFRHVDGTAVQRLYGYQTAYPMIRQRHWITASNAWSTWGGNDSAIDLVLENSWVAFGGTLGIPQARRSADGHVSLSGVMKSGTIDSNTQLFQLPLGYRPAVEGIFLAVKYTEPAATTPCLVRIAVNGICTIAAGASADYLGLDSVSFYAPT